MLRAVGLLDHRQCRRQQFLGLLEFAELEEHRCQCRLVQRHLQMIRAQGLLPELDRSSARLHRRREVAARMRQAAQIVEQRRRQRPLPHACLFEQGHGPPVEQPGLVEPPQILEQDPQFVVRPHQRAHRHVRLALRHGQRPAQHLLRPVIAAPDPG